MDVYLQMWMKLKFTERENNTLEQEIMKKRSIDLFFLCPLQPFYTFRGTSIVSKLYNRFRCGLRVNKGFLVNL